MKGSSSGAGAADREVGAKERSAPHTTVPFTVTSLAKAQLTSVVIWFPLSSKLLSNVPALRPIPVPSPKHRGDRDGHNLPLAVSNLIVSVLTRTTQLKKAHGSRCCLRLSQVLSHR
jgi:hypothetical protein